MKNQLLIIFVKNPQLGRAKTRLAATIGDEAAFEAYKRLLTKTRDVTLELPYDKVVYYDQFVDDTDLWYRKDYDKAVQIAGQLGKKMQDAFERAFEDGYQKICIIGSDCYDLTTEILAQAFDTLEKYDAVMGPSQDGGYYLMGLSKANFSIFQNKEWSTESVASDTIKDFEKEGLSYALLPILNDVDTEADLGEWASDLLKTEMK